MGLVIYQSLEMDPTWGPRGGTGNCGLNLQQGE